PEITERRIVNPVPASCQAGCPEVLDDQHVGLFQRNRLGVDRAHGKSLAQFLEVKVLQQQLAFSSSRLMEGESNSNSLLRGGVETVLNCLAHQRVRQFNIIVVELVPLGWRAIHLTIAELPEMQLHMFSSLRSPPCFALASALQAEFAVSSLAATREAQLHKVEFALQGLDDPLDVFLGILVSRAIGEISDQSDILARPVHPISGEFNKLAAFVAHILLPLSIER